MKQSVKFQSFFVLLLASIIALFGLSGCEQTPELKQPFSEEYREDIDKALSVLEQQGYVIEDYTILDSLIIVEGDIAFSLNNLNKMYEQKFLAKSSAQIHYRTVRHEYITYCKIAFEDYNYIYGVRKYEPLSEEWKSATREAIKKWNDIPYSKVLFILVDEIEKANTIISKSFALDDNVSAFARFPWAPWYEFDVSTGYPGSYLVVNAKLFQI